jgi:hypothetical protein
LNATPAVRLNAHGLAVFRRRLGLAVGVGDDPGCAQMGYAGLPMDHIE